MVRINKDHAAIAALNENKLLAEKRRAIELVNQHIGQIRSRYITTAPGQEMIYLSKEAEARAYVLDEDPDPNSYPLITAEVGITAATAFEVAQVVLTLANQWRGLAAHLEQARLSAVALINAASSVSEIATVLTALPQSQA